MDGKYRIVLDERVPPVQHPPWRVPVPLREVLKETLDDGGRPQKGWETPHMSGPSRSEQSHSSGTLSSPNNRRRRHSTPRGQGVHSAGCAQGFLACRAGRRILVPHHFQYSVWKIPVKKDALRHLFCTRSVPAMHT